MFVECMNMIVSLNFYTKFNLSLSPPNLHVIAVDVKCFPFSRRVFHGRKMLSFFLDMIDMKENNYDTLVIYKKLKNHNFSYWHTI
jgi:hypothetical protein